MVANYLELPRVRHTLEEYFALLEASDKRWEFWDGELLCMAGGSPEHIMISGNVYYALRKRLEERNCQVFNPDMPIKTPTLPPFRFPDASVVCGKPVFEKVDKFITLVNPLLVVEVLSPGTASLDHNEKKLAYQALPAVQEYLLVAQDAPHVTRFLRQGKRWRRFDYGSLQVVVELSSLECTLPLQEIYQGIEFK